MAPSLKGKKIGVLFTEYDPVGERGRPMISILGRIWTLWGAEVEFIRGVPDYLPECDLLIPHLNLTVVPHDYHAILDRHPNVLNRGVRDISKRKVSGNLVERDTAWEGQVIVKTNLNFGGLPELIHARAEGHVVFDLNAVQRPWRRVETLHPDDYQVFPSIREVPPGVWRNSRLVVEKFMPEQDGAYYCMHVTLALGDRHYSRRLYATEPIVKRSNIVRVEDVETPPGIEEVRTRFGLEYGKMDYVVQDGRVQLFDLNKTPGIPPDPDPENPTTQDLALGIAPFLDV